jgi:hypothetical protein
VSSSFQALDKQFFDFAARSAPRRLQQAGLDPQHLGERPTFPGFVGNGESFLDDIQRGIAAARLGMRLGFEREKDWQPQARAGLAPSRQAFIKLPDPFVDLPLT